MPLLYRGAPQANARRLIFQTEAILFDYGVGQDVTSDAVYFLVRRIKAGVVGQCQNKIFALANVGNTAKLQFFQGSLNGLALRIKDCAL